MLCQREPINLKREKERKLMVSGSGCGLLMGEKLLKDDALRDAKGLMFNLLLCFLENIDCH